MPAEERRQQVFIRLQRPAVLARMDAAGNIERIEAIVGGALISVITPSPMQSTPARSTSLPRTAAAALSAAS